MYLSTITSTQDFSEMYLRTFQVLYKLYLSSDALKYKVLLPGSVSVVIVSAESHFAVSGHDPAARSHHYATSGINLADRNNNAHEETALLATVTTAACELMANPPKVPA